MRGILIFSCHIRHDPEFSWFAISAELTLDECEGSLRGYFGDDVEEWFLENGFLHEAFIFPIGIKDIVINPQYIFGRLSKEYFSHVDEEYVSFLFAAEY